MRIEIQVTRTENKLLRKRRVGAMFTAVGRRTVLWGLKESVGL